MTLDKQDTMKAAFFNKFGAPDVLEVGQRPIPAVSENTVLVQVAATSFNPLDGYQRIGQLGEVEFPHVPQIDYSGVVAKVGSNVTDFKPGDRVFGVNVNFQKDGAAAEYIALSADDPMTMIAKAPKNIPLTDCASLPCAALAAYQGLKTHCQVKSGERVFISGGAGGVGTFAIQIAKQLGAYVIASDSVKNLDLLKELGADEAFGYEDDNLANHAGEKVDAVFNISPISSEAVSQYLPSIKENGRLVSTLNPADEEMAKKCHVNASTMAVTPTLADLKSLVELIDTDAVKPYITKRYSLDQIAQAHETAGGTQGKILIVVNDQLN